MDSRPTRVRPGTIPGTILSLVFAGLLAGCGQVADPAIGGIASIDPPPAVALSPDTPSHLVQTFAQAMNHRDPDLYQQLLTGNFAFAFAASDSFGNAFPDRTLTREQEISSALHLLRTGTATEPPASRVVLTLDRALYPEIDSRPGKAFPWHQEVEVNYVLSVDTEIDSYRLTGAIRFFVVRGDSAEISPDLAARGFHPDRSRWWIERWEDESLNSGANPEDTPTPTRSTTWGRLKVLYL